MSSTRRSGSLVLRCLAQRGLAYQIRSMLASHLKGGFRTRTTLIHGTPVVSFWPNSTALRVDFVVGIRSRDADGAAVVRRAVGSEIQVGACDGNEGNFLVVTRLWMGCFRSGYWRLGRQG
ncbi:hypothetical protein U1Q18_024743 [Sarracenia purpurea var. burkii]